jgi:competence protein ComEC
MFKKHLLDIVSWILCIILLVYPSSKDGVFFLDVGQGDSILIQKGSFQILIDGGEDDSVLYELPKYMKYGDMKIEIVVLTHAHSDHLGGLFEIFERYEIGEVWVNTVEYDSDMYEYFLGLELSFKEVDEGSVYMIDDWELKVLFASENVYEETDNLNNASVVLELITDGRSYLFMGDAEEEVEEYLIESDVLENIDVLKAGHHCSRTASSDAFLDIVNPEVAICSYGEGNSFGHPHEETLERFEERNIQMLSTAEEGNIWVL